MQQGSVGWRVVFFVARSVVSSCASFGVFVFYDESHFFVCVFPTILSVLEWPEKLGVLHFFWGGLFVLRAVYTE